MRVKRNVPRMHAAGSFAAVVTAVELGTADDVVDVDFDFFEPASSEHAAMSAPVRSREISGAVRSGWRCIVRCGV
jgi:hypothetical protein